MSNKMVRSGNNLTEDIPCSFYLNVTRVFAIIKLYMFIKVDMYIPLKHRHSHKHHVTEVAEQLPHLQSCMLGPTVNEKCNYIFVIL